MCVLSLFFFPIQAPNESTGYVNMSPPKNEEAVKDCDAALRLDPNYLKALNRRAAANESLGRYEDALRGV
jgi:mitochondrial import receptor subunit TOM70